MTAIALILLTGLGLPSQTPSGAPDSPRASYETVVTYEEKIGESAPTLRQFRSIISAYDEILRRYPYSSYGDDALWRGANLALKAYQQYHSELDRRTGLRMLEWLESEHPTSSFQSRTLRLREAFGTPNTSPAKRASTLLTHQIQKTSSRSGPVTIRKITRSKIDEVIRITVEMDTEVQYLEERLDTPARVFFDLKGAKPVPGLINAQLIYDDYAAVPEIRLGQHAGNTTRIVIDMTGIARYAVFSVYDPFRLVIDCVLDPERPKKIAAKQKIMSAGKHSKGPHGGSKIKNTFPTPAVILASGPPTEPVENSNRNLSLARQLGLGVSRIVIDPGHGGHDPGAIGRGVVESEIALDVALRLNELLMAKSGFEVVMTRRTDRFVPLKERTAIANRENADLFLSIHANASLKPQVGGIETYYLNFTTDPTAEAVAARENSVSGQSMRSLTDIVQTIAFNNKLDESRDFAHMVQNSMLHRLRPQHNQLRNLGVKQAPFVVLIGAKMPSVLAEISFITNEIESSLLQTDTYRQRAAQALLDAILSYRSSLQKTLETAETF